MNRERLEKLAYLLRNLETEFPQMGGFNLEGWVSTEGDDTGCGTVACACGWAGLWGPFQKEGFRISSDLVPEYEMSVNWLAVCKFFDLDRNEAYWLFCNRSYNHENGDVFLEVTPEHVAARIEALLSGDGQLDPTLGLI